MKAVWDEMIYAARQAPRMFFVPFVGAVRETLRVMREIQEQNRQRNASRTDKPGPPS